MKIFVLICRDLFHYMRFFWDKQLAGLKGIILKDGNAR